MSTELPQIKRLFMLFHGMYGNQLLDKFRTGQTNEAGEDLGILSAQAVWLNGLRDFDFDVIRQAVARCEVKHKTFPPTLPEFRELCKLCQPRQFSAPPAPALPMSDELKDEIKQRNRQMIANLKLGGRGSNNFGTGMPALLLMCAKAIGDAGGDEVKALLQLEAKFTPKHTGA
jgi:hypothetical protein